MSNVNVINNAGKDVTVTVNKENDNVQIVIDLANQTKKVKLADLKPGDVFKANDVEYIVLEQSEITTAILRKEALEEKMKFGEDNNWKTSSIREYLDKTYYEKELKKAFGNENVVAHIVDLLSMDGLDDYGKCVSKASLLTIDQYRKYRKVIGKNLNSWWWLLTPWSTPKGCGSDGVCYVGSDGDVNYCWYGGTKCVRPFCLLKSSIFVSCE